MKGQHVVVCPRVPGPPGLSAHDPDRGPNGGMPGTTGVLLGPRAASFARKLMASFQMDVVTRPGGGERTGSKEENGVEQTTRFQMCLKSGVHLLVE